MIRLFQEKSNNVSALIGCFVEAPEAWLEHAIRRPVHHAPGCDAGCRSNRGTAALGCDL